MNLGGIFELDKKKNELASLEKKMQEENFWQNIDEANKVNQRISALNKEVLLYDKLNDSILNNLVILKSDDDEMNTLISEELLTIKKELDELETSVTLNKKFDINNCFLEIHPGAGGTESCDWVSMLARMYERFAERENFKYEIIDELKGDEAGTKSITLRITGEYAYGYLKNENGVHRLVRISPFDSNKRRHTSFASVTVTPEIDKEINIEIQPEDLKIDVYHSSGAGGQSVNTTNSAVRITHIPSKIVVTCQNERSQLKNKEQALKILKAKLYVIEKEKKEEKINSLKDTSTSINFGSQIRSYVLEPYKMVKDHRTSFETTDPEKILDGNIKELLLYNLKKLL